MGAALIARARTAIGARASVHPQVPFGPGRRVPHFHPQHLQALPDPVPVGVPAGATSLRPLRQERLDPGRQGFTRVAEPRPGQLAQTHNHPPEGGPGRVDLVGLERVSGPRVEGGFEFQRGRRGRLGVPVGEGGVKSGTEPADLLQEGLRGPPAAASSTSPSPRSAGASGLRGVDVGRARPVREPFRTNGSSCTSSSMANVLPEGTVADRPWRRMVTEPRPMTVAVPASK